MSVEPPSSDLKKVPFPDRATWCAMAASADFKHMYAGACNNGRIFASHNSGKNWIATNSMKSKYWTQIATDESGKIVAAASSMGTGGLYISNDYGWNWNATFPISALSSSYKWWEGVAMDVTGQYMTAALRSIGMFYSRDYGVTWNPATTLNRNYQLQNINWRTIKMSKDGKHQVATTYFEGVVVSHDFGATWNRTHQITNHWLKGVSMDDTGKYQVMTVTKSGIYYSNDYGDHWEMYPKSPSGDWREIACASPSCQVVYAANWRKLVESDDVEGELVDAAVLKSVNYGETWQRTGTPSGEGWTALLVDSTGNRVIVGLDGAPFYQTSDGGKTWSRYGWSDKSPSTSDIAAYVFLGAVIGIVILIPIIWCIKMRNRLTQQNELIRNLERQQQVLQRTVRSAITSNNDRIRDEIAPVQAVVELGPMRIGDADVESVPAVTAIVLGPMTTTTPSVVVHMNDQAAEKEKLLSEEPTWEVAEW